MWSTTSPRFCQACGTGFLCVFIFIHSTGGAEEEPEGTVAEKALAAAREKLMATRVASMRVTWPEEAAKRPESFEPQPIFRYSDPARGYVAAAVWALGKNGRPLAVVTTELQPRFYGRPRIVYEYLSLTSEPFAVASPDVRWSPKSSAIEFRPIPNSPKPADNERLRLVQMRSDAKRMTAYEVVGNERCELRMVPQPIHRYRPSSHANADGAMFLLAFGINPEAIVFLESDGDRWQFAVGRLAGAAKMGAFFDEQPVWETGPAKYGVDEPYTASNAVADIPGIAADGSVIPPEK